MPEREIVRWWPLAMVKNVAVVNIFCAADDDRGWATLHKTAIEKRYFQRWNK
jgi:hypothetical protein